jgi:hypothetical protein
MTEAQFQAKVIRFLKEQNIYLVKVWGGGFQKSGIPDLLCCVNGYFVAVELKSEKGLTAKLQDYNLDRIRESGGVGMVLRPADFERFKSFIKEVMGCPKLNIPTLE